MRHKVYYMKPVMASKISFYVIFSSTSHSPYTIHTYTHSSNTFYTFYYYFNLKRASVEIKGEKKSRDDSYETKMVRWLERIKEIERVV